MWRIFLLTFIALFCISACALASASVKTDRALSCKVHGQFVVVTFNSSNKHGNRNPKYFGAGTGDDFIYLNYPPAHAKLTPCNIHTRILKLNIKSQRGIQYKNGSASQVKLFSRPAVYRLLFADNIETEPDNTFSLQCSVKINSDVK